MPLTTTLHIFPSQTHCILESVLLSSLLSLGLTLGFCQASHWNSSDQSPTDCRDVSFLSCYIVPVALIIHDFWSDFLWLTTPESLDFLCLSGYSIGFKCSSFSSICFLNDHLSQST
jgi:hypothetical protein